jgi:DNA-binding beta-propeller fold protein YncE
MKMKQLNLLFSLIVCIAISYPIIGQNKSDLKILTSFHITSAGGWDYLAINGDKLYVSHGTQVNILDKKTGDSLGVILNTTGVHGIAFNEKKGRGYTSNGRLNNVTVFELKTDKPLSQISTGENPDAILYDQSSNKIITCNGRSKNLTIIDADSEKVIDSIAVGGKPETLVSNGEGLWFVNVEDKNEVVQINAKTLKVENHWALNPGESPTGLAINNKNKRLYVGCEDQLIVMDATNGKVMDSLPIGAGCDGVAFDAETKMIYTSNGAAGTMTIIEEKSDGTYAVIDNLATKKGARTIALDDKTHLIYLPTAEFEPLQADAPKGTRPKMIPSTFQVLMVGK